MPRQFPKGSISDCLVGGFLLQERTVECKLLECVVTNFLSQKSGCETLTITLKYTWLNKMDRVFQTRLLWKIQALWLSLPPRSLGEKDNREGMKSRGPFLVSIQITFSHERLLLMLLCEESSQGQALPPGQGKDRLITGHSFKSIVFGDLFYDYESLFGAEGWGDREKESVRQLSLFSLCLQMWLRLYPT